MNADEFNTFINSQREQRHAITLLARQLSVDAVNHITDIISDHQLTLETMTQLSEPNDTASNVSSRHCIEFLVRGDVEKPALFKQDLLSITHNGDTDVVLQADNLSRRHRRLAVFDMDSTLIQCEVMDELAKVAGVGDEVAAITASAMRGEIPFNESFERRLSTLKGLDESALQKISAEIPMTEGAERLLRTLKKLGYKIAILSGGFSYFADHLKEKYDLDYVFANELDIVEGKLTGKVKGEIVNGEKKEALIKTLANELNIEMEQTIAVGDGANDLPMIGVAGLGVAFHAKPIVKENAQHAISSVGLDGLLYLMGIQDSDILN